MEKINQLILNGRETELLSILKSENKPKDEKVAVVKAIVRSNSLALLRKCLREYQIEGLLN